MYKIEKKHFGYKLTFAGTMTPGEMFSWVEDSHQVLKSACPPFGVYVDMTDLRPLTTESQRIMEAGQRMYKDAGMERSMVVVSDEIVEAQFKMLAKKSGIYAWERYIHTDIPNYEVIAINWITDTMDPDAAICK